MDRSRRIDESSFLDENEHDDQVPRIPGVNNDEEQCVFSATLENCKQFIQLLKSLAFKEKASFTISQHGLKVMVQDSKSMQLSAYFLQTFFHEFKLQGQDNDNAEENIEYTFTITLNSVINCLELFGDTLATRLKLSYRGYGEPLNMYLDDHDVTMQCQIMTQDPEDCADFNFARSRVLAKVIMISEQFKDVVSALQGLSDDVMIKVTEEGINFSVSSIFGDMNNEISRNSPMVDNFSCNAPTSANYSLSMLRQGLKPINFSSKLSIRIDSRDLLCIQHMIGEEDEVGHAFTEVYCVPCVPL